ncbi:hypothetical protein HDU99_000819, partial [Rhizoclosmatium hyalinum]
MRLFVTNGTNTIGVEIEFGRGPLKNLPLEIVGDIVADAAARFGLIEGTCSLYLPPSLGLPSLGLNAGDLLQSHVPITSLIAAGAGVAPPDGSAPSALVITTTM